jgi:hypothetical protein
MNIKCAAAIACLVSGCSVDIAVPAAWTDLSCSEDAQCTGVVVTDICNKARALGCADIPLQTANLNDYEAAYRSARDSCLFGPPTSGNDVVCEEGYICVENTCEIGPFQAITSDGE